MSIQNSSKKLIAWNKSKSSKTLLTSNIITTPYEKVLSIIKEAKKFIINYSKNENKLIQSLDWVIKIITSRSLYSYELKEKEKINQLSKENPEFKQLVDFVSEYNEKVIKMNRKYNYILSDKLLQKPSINLNRKRIERKTSFGIKSSNYSNLLGLEDITKPLNIKQNKKYSNKNNNFGVILGFNKDKALNNINTQNTISNPYINKMSNKNINEASMSNNSIKMDKNPFEKITKKIKRNIKKERQNIININDEENKNTENLSFYNKNNFFTHKSGNTEGDSMKKYNINKKSKRYSLFPSVQKISITINNNDNIENNIKEINEIEENDLPIKRTNTSINAVNISLTNSIICQNSTQKKYFSTKKAIKHINKGYSFIKIQNELTHEGYDSIKLINEKNFDIFQIKDLIGYNNVLPFVGRIILENLGLIDEEILNIQKIDLFLVSVTKQYKKETLYHNSLHGADVTQSCYIFFSHTNAEKIAKTNVLDLLSIFISSLGHDIGHPGLTNTFHINDSTEMAITYNDISVLENFHASTLFKIIRKTETNIFEKLTTIDYKIIRKRMIAEILATDMANHSKITSLIKSKISLSENGKDYKLNLLTGNEQTKNEEQQCLLDFIIHLADLAHNTRLFNISLKWVELLSEEFWLQGDLEKQHNLPVSFLCDRENTNVPQSQKGFITGFIIPTFEILTNIFPTLKFTLDNANKNYKQWQKLLNEGRLKGWTPPKKAQTINNDKNNIKQSVDLKKNAIIPSLKVNENKKNNKIKRIRFNSMNTFNVSDFLKNNKNNIYNTIEYNKQRIKTENKKIKNNNMKENSKNKNKKIKKIFTTPVKLRINDDSLFKDKKKNEFLVLSCNRKDKQGNIKKFVFKNGKKV